LAQIFSKVLSVVSLYRIYTRALTFENLFQEGKSSTTSTIFRSLPSTEVGTWYINTPHSSHHLLVSFPPSHVPPSRPASLLPSLRPSLPPWLPPSCPPSCPPSYPPSFLASLSPLNRLSRAPPSLPHSLASSLPPSLLPQSSFSRALTRALPPPSSPSDSTRSMVCTGAGILFFLWYAQVPAFRPQAALHFLQKLVNLDPLSPLLPSNATLLAVTDKQAHILTKYALY
jgi:hypothetical protein